MPQNSSAHILVVDDEPDIRAVVQDILEDEGYQVETADGAVAARAARRRQRPDLILLDIWMPDTDGISLLREWGEQNELDCPVVMISGHGTVETAVEATRLGAYDFIEKPLSLAKLLLTVERALEASRLREENRDLRGQVADAGEPRGNSALIRALREQIRRVAGLSTRVLLRGEAGTGKESLARWLHALSPRCDAPFVTMAPGSIARENVSTALFGSEDDSGVHYGLIEQASGGSLFIDEVGDLDPELQLRLCSVLEGSTLLRVGGADPVAVDVRVIAASSRDLEAEIRAGRFREELYYLINVLPIAVPALRERPEDVATLLEYYADFFARRDGLPLRGFSETALSSLRRHNWPGNLRELKNLVQRLLILGHGPNVDGGEIDATLGNSATRAATAGSVGIDTSLPLREAREHFERSYLLAQLSEAGGSVGKLAKLAGMERTHLYRKLRALGVDIREHSRDD